MILGILAVSGTAAAIIYVLQMPYFQINSIKISGLVSLDETEIRQKLFSHLDGKVAMFLPRKSFFFVSSRDAEALLKNAFPRIAAVSAVKIFPQELSVKISERNLWGIYCNDFRMEAPPEDPIIKNNIQPQDQEIQPSNCAYVDQEGFAYEFSPISAGSLLIKIHGDGEFAVPSQAIPRELVGRMNEFSRELKNSLGLDTSGFEFSKSILREFRVKTSEGFSLWINRDDNFVNVLKVLKTVLDEEIKDRRDKLEYADLRFGNKVFYKYRK